MKDFLAAVLISALGKIVADESRDFLTWLPGKLIRWAAQRLTADEMKVRMEEEWLAHSNDLPSNLAKVSHALGCVGAALQISHTLQRAVWWIFIAPHAELVVIFALFQYWLTADPETLRARRLQRRSGGIIVLGLNALDLELSDYENSWRMWYWSQEAHQKEYDHEAGWIADRVLVEHLFRSTRRNVRFLGLTLEIDRAHKVHVTHRNLCRRGLDAGS